ncbi:MAG: outer membrane beta-barrel protein [Verrucomicrobia bacterium]|nr:outer membrane beta-barrel protein [Verrucomicrobiota bacterium]
MINRHRWGCAALGSALAAGLCLLGGGARTAAEDGTGLYLSGDLGPNFMPDPTVRPGGGILSMDPGVRFDGALGYNFNSWLGVEGESGFLYNSTSHDPRHAWLGQMPMLANLVVRYERNSPWVPYAGIGVGGVVGFLNNDQGCDTDGEFAWQFMVGIRYRLRQHLAVDLAYKYLGTSDQYYNIGGPIVLSDLNNHMFALSLTWSF